MKPRRNGRLAGTSTRPAVCSGVRAGLLLVGVLMLSCCGAPDYRRVTGTTMGTYFSITARCPSSAPDLEQRINSVLAEVNAEMSTYDENSTLSRFNRYAGTDWFAVEPALVDVVAAALTISRESDGAFDVTVGPLVNLWGFGPERSTPEPPTAQALAAARSRVGYQYLEVRAEPPALRKAAPVYVDLSAIAKGFGVDRAAAQLTSAGCSDFLVDIGGEVRLRGSNPAGSPWRVGVEVPDPDSVGGVQRVLLLGDGAVATSGDYRNFRDVGGRRVSHTIDPRTGAPVAHDLASVSVVHSSAMWADGYATALDVVGPDAALVLADRLQLPVLLVVRTAGGFEERYNPLMSKYLASP